MTAIISPRQIYLAECERHGCKPNSSLRELLPGDTATEMNSLDPGPANFVGPTGSKAVIGTVRDSHAVKHLNLSGNGITAEVVEYLCVELNNHPSLTSIDLSGNPISYAGGKSLERFVAQNQRIVELKLDGTLINPAVVRHVQELVCLHIRSGLARPPLDYLSLLLELDEHRQLAAFAPIRRVLERRKVRAAAAPTLAPLDCC